MFEPKKMVLRRCPQKCMRMCVTLILVRSSLKIPGILEDVYMMK